MSPIVLAFVLAQTAAPARPAAPPDPAPVTEGDVTEAHLGGMTLLVKRRPTAELVAVQLHVLGGARNWTAADAGVEALAFRVAATGGAGTLDKEALGRRLASLGATLQGSTGRDDSALAAKAPAAAFEAVFGLVADAFLAPALPEAEVTLARGQALLALQQERENPDGALGLLVERALLAGTPYANRPQGTPETVAKLGRDALAAQLAKLREGSRLLLVVVGPVEPERVIALARQAYGGLPRGSFAPAPFPRPAFTAPSLSAEQRTLPTNYLQVMFAAPGPGAPDYPAARIASFVLNQRLFEEVRTKRNLSYAPGARYDVAAGAAFGGFYVTAVDPAAALPVMVGELQRLATQPVPAAELEGAKSTFRTGFLMGQETNDAQAASLARGLVQAGDWRYFGRLLEGAAKVSAADVQAYAGQYARNLQAVVLGDPAKVDPKLTAR